MVTDPKHFLTEDEYLAFERQSDVRHEYYNGEIFAMTGARFAHNQIVSNLIVSLAPQLRAKNCSVLANEMRVKISATGLYAYPDLSIVCGERHFLDDQFDTLLNPVVLLEVLSRTTEAYDRGRKFEQYATVESMQEYILVSQYSHRVELFQRQPGAPWLYRDVKGLDSVLSLSSVGAELKLADVYFQVAING